MKKPKFCRGCLHLWTGRADKVPWCCWKGASAKKSIGHCILNQAKRVSHEKSS